MARWRDARTWGDVRAGQIAAAIYNVARDPKKGSPVTWDVFFPQPETRRRSAEPDDDQRYQMFRAWAHVHNARIVREGSN